ncbi:MAG: HTH-type transcriptional regulator ImmR [Firmicutes bacterium ADurb.Bin248]|nr:MAG: HTH-type transcriptional regulator ImmR [Firmicutes bacterium ADurb.Bin248]
MILADKILQLRRSNGWSQEELAERLNISRQSVSKWESAQSIPDIGKILELSQIFGVTTDYLLKDEIEKPAYSGTDSLSNLPGVSVQEANSYMEACARYARRVGMGVALCILSPALLILLIGFAMSNLPDMVVSERAATGAGTAILLAMVAAGVTLIVVSATRMRRYGYLKRGDFELQYGVEGIVRGRRDSFEGRHTAMVAIAISLCILCPVPLILAGIMEAPEFTLTLLTSILLLTVAVAVFLFILAGIMKACYDRLLGEGEYSFEEREESKRKDKFGAIYWPCATAVYLGVSFLTDRWDATWVMWPVVGLLFVAVTAALKAKNKE